MLRSLAITSLFLAALPCFGTIRYVTTTGNDANGCTVGSPCLTVARGIAVASASDTVAVQSGTYTVTTTTTCTPALTIQGYAVTAGDNGTAPLITTATNSTTLFFDNSGCTFQNLSLSTTASVKANGIERRASHGGTLTLLHVKMSGGFVDCADGDNAGSTFDWGNIFVGGGSVFNGCTTYGITDSSATNFFWVSGAEFVSNGIGIKNTNGNIQINHTIFGSNTSGVTTPGSWVGMVAYSSFLSNTAGMSIGGNLTAYITNTYFFGNTAGISGSSTAYTSQGVLCDTGMTLASDTMCNAKTLTASPIVGAGNYALNSTAGGGALLKALAVPGAFADGLTTSAGDIGAVQSTASGGGGGASMVSF